MLAPFRSVFFVLSRRELTWRHRRVIMHFIARIIFRIYTSMRLPCRQEYEKSVKGVPPVKKKKWTFLTNHGRILAYIAKHPQITTQAMAQKAELSIRMVQQIITDLENSGYIERHKDGRRNRYTINTSVPMRHRLERDHAIGEILFALGYQPKQEKISVKLPV